MLSKRIIPSLLHKGTSLRKGEKWDNSRVVGNVMQAARTHAARGVDELLILDVFATQEGRGPDFALIEKMSEENFAPIAVGGGIKTVADVKRLLRSGADKVVIGTEYQIIRECADRFGCQAIVAAVAGDHVELSRFLAKEGAGEILLFDRDREGTMTGYNIELVRSVCNAVDVPVIVASGCSGYEDMYKAIKAGANAVSAGALFQFTDATPKEAAKYLSDNGIETRL